MIDTQSKKELGNPYVSSNSLQERKFPSLSNKSLMYIMPLEYQIVVQTTVLAIMVFLLNHIEISSMSFLTLEIDLYSNQAKSICL